MNELVRGQIESQPGGYYVDVFSAMLDPAGNPRPEFFLADGLHLNRKGYRLWGGRCRSWFARKLGCCVGCDHTRYSLMEERPKETMERLIAFW